jgi:hypothetical protein
MPKPKSRARPPVEKIELPPPGSGKGEFRKIAGSASDDFNQVTIVQALRSLWLAHANEEDKGRFSRAAAAAMTGIGPREELEGMLAAQLVATHAAAMESYRRAMIPEQTFEGRRENLNQANKLVRSYAALVEALDRHRGKGEQRIVIERVDVRAGGRAIVGAVSQGGGGPPPDFEERAHAPEPAALTHEQGNPLWSADQARDTVPVTGDIRA